MYSHAAELGQLNSTQSYTRRMHKSLILAGALTMSACGNRTANPSVQPSPAPTGAATHSRVIPFRLRSGTGGDFDEISATAEVRENEIRVILQSGHLELTASSAARPRGVRAVLAYGDTAAQWDIRSRGTAVSVGSIHARGDTLTAPVELSIPLPEHIVLADHWIVLLLEADVNVPGRGWFPGSFRPIHSERSLFAGLPRP